MAIHKAVILAAGLGTRLLPTTKELPKEMLPLYVKEGDMVLLKPVLQVIYEQLYEAGIRDFCFIVGRGKRTVEDHFTPDWDFLEFLESKGKVKLARMLKEFYEKVENSTIVWINQPKPRGTGDALLRARRFAEDEPFIVCAGDNLLLTDRPYMKELVEFFDKHEASCVLIVKQVKDPKAYGVIEGEEVYKEVYLVKNIVEKPKHPPSNLANTSIYAFSPIVFKALQLITPSPRGELELTSAISLLLQWNLEVYAIEVSSALWIDVGNPSKYLEALLMSHYYASPKVLSTKEYMESLLSFLKEYF
ncbi:MAG: hypothetical protein DRJ52_01505 [Thermoprotei archaeon]|nr:MAG: hypothetical protein DRJ52_01505 [Thermoprotei archaeon]RLF00166.1 MAG: hypothetical protein DRJ63_03325 [Thermoprotei archaeon]HDI74996.1 hypothetical protein [Thermoprotei archaeon]